MRFNLWKYSTLSLVLFLAICIACSSKLDSNNHSSQNPDPDLQPQAKMLQAGTTHAGGFHYMGQNATTKTSVAFKWGLIPKVYAQTVTTISYTGSYTGRCQMLSSEHQENGINYAVVGKLGRYDDQNCGSGHRGSTTYWEDPINAPVGEPVVGDGTIGNLYLMADVWGTEVDRNITGYVYVNGIQTVVGCQLLPINDLVGTHPTYTMLTSGKHMECITPESVTAPVNHRDKIKVVLAGFDMGPWIVDVHVLLGKW